jgi:Type II CAAX prenyl endopeptidase Rce1-like
MEVRSKMVLTLMPDADSYGIVVLVLNGAGSSSLALWLHRRWPNPQRIPYSHVYILVVLGTCIWGALVFDFHPLLGTVDAILLAVPFGIIGGYLATRADRAIVRLAARRAVSAPSPMDRGSGYSPRQRISLTPSAVLSLSGAGGHRPIDIFDEHGFQLSSLVALAVLEELLYRGWFLEACRLLTTSALRGTAMAFTVAAFSLLHLRFGWSHVFAKAILGLLALVGVLVTGSLASAIVTHVWFNVRVWRDR